MKKSILILTLLASTYLALANVSSPIPSHFISPFPDITSLLSLSPLPVSDRKIFSIVCIQKNLYINISKPKRTLYVYEKRCTGTVLIAAYPVCLGANTGDKQRQGDLRTPESNDGIPFTISSIENASNWKHNFGDGRGPMPAYGQWFMRLHGNFPGSGIGIHGSTGNRYSVPGRGSEGCIRLRDEDIIHLRENYAFVGMKVFIERDIDS